MTICLAALLQCFTGGPLESGYASQYGPGVMEATIAARKEWGHLPPSLERYQVFAAVADCRRIGDEFLLRHDGEWLLGLATDCSGHAETSRWMEENRILVEVDYDTAVSWDVVGVGGVVVDFVWIAEQLPAHLCRIAL